MAGISIWLSFPPANWSWLAWVAPVPLVRLIALSQWNEKRPYRAIYAAGFLHWLLMVQWIRLPHWTAAIGWIVLAAYLAVYVPLFVAIARVLVHRAKCSELISVPVAWVAAEYVRSTAITGFPLVPLSHTQANFPAILQIAQFTGGYGISFLIMLVATLAEQLLRPVAPGPLAPASKPFWLAVGMLLVVVILAISASQELGEVDSNSPSANIAIIQGTLDTIFDDDSQRRQLAFQEYMRLSLQASWSNGGNEKQISTDTQEPVGRSSSSNVELVIWPESMFPFGILEYPGDVGKQPAGSDLSMDDYAAINKLQAEETIQRIGTHCLVGTDTVRFLSADKYERFNTAALYAPDGRLVGQYHKMHPVMFGEYVPLGKTFPWLYRLTPMGSGLTPGKQPEAFQVGGLAFAPNVCFENTLPQLVTRQLRQLHSRRQHVDALVTLTNDGWFWGSSLLDVHLACGIFRAIENRLPVLIAANTGFSAHIDASGRVLQKGPRRAPGVLLATIHASPDHLTFYTRWGDWFPFSCLVFSAIVGFLNWSRLTMHKSVA